MSIHDNDFLALIRNYLVNRNAMQRQTQGNFAFAPGTTGPAIAQRFNRMIVGFGDELAGLLPTMNLDEWQALQELVSSHLAELRMKETKE